MALGRGLVGYGGAVGDRLLGEVNEEHLAEDRLHVGDDEELGEGALADLVLGLGLLADEKKV